MSLTRIALAALIMLASSTAHAGEESQWYGWQLMISDATADAMIFGGYAHDRDDNADPDRSRSSFDASGLLLMAGGVILHGVGGPIIHGANGQGDRASLSLGGRIGLPLIGYMVGEKLCRCNAGLVVGLLVSQALDAGLLAHKPGEPAAFRVGYARSF